MWSFIVPFLQSSCAAATENSAPATAFSPASTPVIASVPFAVTVVVSVVAAQEKERTVEVPLTARVRGGCSVSCTGLAGVAAAAGGRGRAGRPCRGG